MRLTSVVKYTALVFAFAFTFACAAQAQQNPTGVLQGTVLDPSGAVITGAAVAVTNTATATVINAVSGSDGRFVVPNLAIGTYNVTVTKEGFKTGVFTAVNIVVNQTYSLSAKLEVGATSVTVEVQSGAEVLQTSSTSVGTTITGPEITSLPFTSRDASDLAILDPGAQTDGRPRNTSFDGLPKGAINMTEDGINVQDNLLKSSDGFFTIIRPRIDDISQMSITTAANSAADSGEGAVQINFVSQGGTNQFHGGVWEYNRNTAYDANYYFNNEAGIPRSTIDSNQFGFKIGGPILKNKLFFYADLDMYRFPHSLPSTATILTPQAAQGVMTYQPADANGNACTPGTLASPTEPGGCVGTGQINPWTNCDAASGTCTSNLLTMAANFGGPSTPDSFTAPILAAMSSALTAPGVGTSLNPPSPYQDQISFLSTGTDKRYFPDLRLDYDITKTQSIEFDYHYDSFDANPDFLNGFEASLPVAPFNTNEGGQISNRNLWVGAWRWTIGNNKTNELRFGIQDAPVSFFPNLNIGFYPTATTDLATQHIQPQFAAFNAGVMTEPYLPFATQGRNTALGQLIENFGWTKGSHSMSFGMTTTDLRFNDFFAGGELGTVPLGIASTDPMNAQFTNQYCSPNPCTGTQSNGNLPGMNPADVGSAQQIYADVVGTVGQYTAQSFISQRTRQFQAGIPQIDRVTDLEMGFYGTDSWQVRPGLTFNYGLRWEYEGIPHDQLNQYFNLAGGFAAAYGVSGQGNLFKPGTMTGSVPEFVLNGNNPWYNKYFRAWAPSVGLAWQPRFGSGFLQKAFGGSGQTVFRAGYGISYTREGLNNFLSLGPLNPGFSGNQFMFPVAPAAGGNVAGTGQFNAGTVAIGKLNFPEVAQSPTSFTPAFALDPQANFNFGMNVYDPNLHPPQVQSWSAGIQRQIGRDMAFEVRYVGNHGVGLWDQVDLNEVNIFENNFLNEFKNAQANLIANGGSSFADTGAPGTVSVPIFTAAFTGSTSGPQTDSNFSSSQFTTPIAKGQAGSVANTLAKGTLFFLCNMAGSSVFPSGECQTSAPMVGAFPKNFFTVNPDATGGSFYLYNGAQSTYNSLQTVFRRRLSAGLQFEASYAWSKSLTNFYASSASSFYQFRTLRNPGLDKGPAPFDIRNQFKMESLWQLPFGPGHRLSTSNGFINRIIGGWSFNTINRWQTGRPVVLTGGLGGTFNANDGGVNIVGMSLNQIQSQLHVIKGKGEVFWFPANLLDGSQRRANSAIFQSCTTPGAFCGRPFIYGPQFFRADWSLVKDTKITERVTFELRADALNAFNDADFYYAGSASANSVGKSIRSSTFGRITSAYQDISTTDDPGGRLLQLVGKISF